MAKSQSFWAFLSCCWPVIDNAENYLLSIAQSAALEKIDNSRMPDEAKAFAKTQLIRSFEELDKQFDLKVQKLIASHQSAFSDNAELLIVPQELSGADATYGGGIEEI